jgi:hypothetical protein
MPIVASREDRVRVYRFQLYDVSKDELITSTRYATKDTIDRIGGIHLGAPVEVPASDVDQDGFTQKHYVPV